MEATSSLTELNDPLQLGEVGGESEGGEPGGEVNIEVGEETNEPLVPYESKSKRRRTGDP